MKLAFYKGKGNMVTRLIRLLTAGPYSHVELVFSNGRCFSSSARKPDNGVRWKIQDLTSGWDVIELPDVSAEDEERLIWFADQFVGRPFNWAGLWSFVFPWLRSTPGDWFCSEVIIMVLQDCLGLLKDLQRKTSPNALYRTLMRFADVKVRTRRLLPRTVHYATA